MPDEIERETLACFEAMTPPPGFADKVMRARLRTIRIRRAMTGCAAIAATTVLAVIVVPKPASEPVLADMPMEKERPLLLEQVHPEDKAAPVEKDLAKKPRPERKAVVVKEEPLAKDVAKEVPPPDELKVARDPSPANETVAYAVLLSTPSAPVFHDSRKMSSGGTTKVNLKAYGTIKIGDTTTPFIVTFVYRSNGDVQIDSHPWAIVKKDGISIGRTPRPWTSSEGVKRYEFISPGQAPMTVTIKMSLEK